MENDATRPERATSTREGFTPYIHVDGEATMPNGITMFAVTGGKWNLIQIPPTILELPTDDQLAAVSELMRSYLAKHDGQCPFFGRVTGFKLVRLRDYFQFDAEGRLLERVEKMFRRGAAVVAIR